MEPRWTEGGKTQQTAAGRIRGGLQANMFYASFRAVYGQSHHRRHAVPSGGGAVCRLNRQFSYYDPQPTYSTGHDGFLFFCSRQGATWGRGHIIFDSYCSIDTTMADDRTTLRHLLSSITLLRYIEPTDIAVGSTYSSVKLHSIVLMISRNL